MSKSNKTPSLFPQLYTTKTAHLSDDRRYRYALSRIWEPKLPTVTFICLNPSTADATLDDPTLRRCMGYARAWDYGGVHIVNLFAYRATDPKELDKAADPIGPENDRWVVEIAEKSAVVVAAWGTKGSFMGRDAVVKALIPKLSYLKLTQKGHPSHPLYLKKDLKPQKWE